MIEKTRNRCESCRRFHHQRLRFLKFLDKFQGWEAKLPSLEESTINICPDLIQFEERRRRLKEKGASHKDDQKHQKDMVDVMLSSEVDGEEPFTDQEIIWNVLVIQDHTPLAA